MSKAQSNGKVIPLADSQLLNVLEERFAATLENFQEGCSILAEIKDKGLWEYEYKSFEEYCRKKWDIGKSRAYQRIEAHETMQLLDKAGVDSTVVENERQLRALKKANPEDRPAILEAVKESGPITAKAIRAEIAKRNPPAPPAPAPIKLARVVTPEPIEATSAADYEQRRTDKAREMLQAIRSLADDFEIDIEIPSPDTIIDFEKYGERLLELARLVRRLGPVSR